jgi:hypothetical protein
MSTFAKSTLFFAYKLAAATTKDFYKAKQSG